MTFDDVPAGAAVFLDANTLVYAIIADPSYGSAAKKLLDRIEHQVVQGFASSSVVSDMAHRVMTY